VGPRGRKEYTLTSDGLAELQRWLLETTPEPQKNEMLLRVWLLGALTRDQARGYLAWLEQRAVKNLGELEAAEADNDWPEADLPFYGRLVLEYGKRLYAMQREWAAWAAAQIQASPADDGSSAPG
jgi:hypothetical protein